MSKLSTSDFLAGMVRFVPRVFNVEGVPVEMIGLTDEAIQDVRLCATSEGVYLAAADFGMSSGGVRVCDDELLSEYIDKLWEHEDYKLDCDPSFKVKVGEKVCAISGLTKFVEDKYTEEKRTIDGDNLGDTGVSLDELYQDKAVA
jgi:hypothetical protein